MGVAERKEREKEFRRKCIIDAAESVFFSKGFEHATMNDVAKESELSKGTLYLYFSSKNELCMAIIIRSLDTIFSFFLEIAASSKSGLEKLKNIADGFLQFTQEHPKYYQSLLTFRNHSIDCSETGEIYQTCINKNLQINDLLVKIINSGINDGSISEKTDSTKLSQALWGNLTGFLPGCILSSNGNNTSAPATILNYIFELIEKAIKN